MASDLLDEMYEILLAIHKTAAFSELQDWNSELASEVEDLIARYKAMQKVNRND